MAYNENFKTEPEHVTIREGLSAEAPRVKELGWAKAPSPSIQLPPSGFEIPRRLRSWPVLPQF